jgi:hypothetical protein
MITYRVALTPDERVRDMARFGHEINLVLQALGQESPESALLRRN